LATILTPLKRRIYRPSPSAAGAKRHTGPPAGLNSNSPCKSNKPVLEPKLKATAKRLGNSRYAIRVTASIAGAGANEGRRRH
jgi:hypothetical protein